MYSRYKSARHLQLSLVFVESIDSNKMICNYNWEAKNQSRFNQRLKEELHVPQIPFYIALKIPLPAL